VVRGRPAARLSRLLAVSDFSYARLGNIPFEFDGFLDPTEIVGHETDRCAFGSRNHQENIGSLPRQASPIRGE
jgi:hypothetical protein